MQRLISQSSLAGCLLLSVALTVSVRAAPAGNSREGERWTDANGEPSGSANSLEQANQIEAEEDPYAEALNEVFLDSETEQCGLCSKAVFSMEWPIRSKCGLHCYHQRCYQRWQEKMSRVHRERIPATGDTRCPVCSDQVHPCPALNTEEVEDLSGENAEEVCPICHDELGRSGQPVVATKCSHLFHSSCIKSWARRAYAKEVPTDGGVLCPVCRANING